MRLRLWSSLLLASGCLLTPCTSRAQGHWEYRTFEHDGLTRGFQLYVPDLYDGSESRPLVLGFETWYAPTYLDMQRLDRLPQVADTANVLVVYPEAKYIRYPAVGEYVGPGWNVDGSFGPWDDVGFVRRVVDEIELEYAVDRTRIHAVGYSFGAHMAFTLSCRLADVIASVGGVSGTLVDRWHEPGECVADRPVSVLQMHGTADKTQPYEGFFPGPDAYNGDYAEMSAFETVLFWSERNHCATGPVITDLPDVDPADGTYVARFRWSDCDAGTEVVHYQIEGGGHTWPGREKPNGPSAQVVSFDLDATPVIWDFLRRNAKPVIGSTDPAGVLPTSTGLLSNYPNPFHSVTTIAFELSVAGEVNLSVHDGLGRMLIPIDEGDRRAGRHEVRLDLHGRPSGVYLVRLQAGGRVSTRPIVLLR